MLALPFECLPQQVIKAKIETGNARRHEVISFIATGHKVTSFITACWVVISAETGDEKCNITKQFKIQLRPLQ